MTEATPQAVRDYLSQLDSALADVEPEVRLAIVAGIREELDGLDDAAASARIDDLGDPAFIAAEAKAATPVTEPTVGPSGPPPGRTLSIVAVLVLIIGAFLIPLVGPLIGLIWVSFSTAWSRREKLAAWLVPVAVAIVIAVVNFVTAIAQQETSTASTGPAVSFMGLAGWHLAILVPYFVLPIIGVVLFVRANRRGWKQES